MPGSGFKNVKKAIFQPNTKHMPLRSKPILMILGIVAISIASIYLVVRFIPYVQNEPGSLSPGYLIAALLLVGLALAVGYWLGSKRQISFHRGSQASATEDHGAAQTTPAHSLDPRPPQNAEPESPPQDASLVKPEFTRNCKMNWRTVMRLSRRWPNASCTWKHWSISRPCSSNPTRVKRPKWRCWRPWANPAAPAGCTSSKILRMNRDAGWPARLLNGLRPASARPVEQP